MFGKYTHDDVENLRRLSPKWQKWKKIFFKKVIPFVHSHSLIFFYTIMWCILKLLTKNHNQLDKTHNEAEGRYTHSPKCANIKCLNPRGLSPKWRKWNQIFNVWCTYLLIAATYQYLKQYYVVYTQVGSCSFKFAYRKSNI